MISSSLLKAWITLMPPKVSSMWPLTWPRCSCCARKYFWLRLTTTETNTTEIGRISSATMVSTQSMENIIHSTPIIVVIEVMSWMMLWLRFIDSVSTSLVMIERTSPCCWRSKKRIGSRLIFSLSSLRIR